MLCLVWAQEYAAKFCTLWIAEFRLLRLVSLQLASKDDVMRTQQSTAFPSRGAQYNTDATTDWGASAAVLAAVFASPGLKYSIEGVLTSGALSLSPSQHLNSSLGYIGRLLTH